jgi:hypothetical protein
LQIDKENFKLQEKLSNFKLAQSLATKFKRTKEIKKQADSKKDTTDDVYGVH